MPNNNLDSNREKVAEIIRQGFIPILVNDRFDPLFLAGIVAEVGLRVIEYSLQRKDAAEKLPELRKAFPHLIILAASVIDDEEMVTFLKARNGTFCSVKELYEMDVDGIVSLLPFKAETYQKYQEKMLFIPGVETAAEAFHQLGLGAHLLKFFNTEGVGVPARIKVLQGSTHSLFPILATGGITLETVSRHLESGVLVVGSGFGVILGEKYEEIQDNPDRTFIVQRLKAYIDAVRDARAKIGKSDLGEETETEKLLKITGKYFGGLEKER